MKTTSSDRAPADDSQSRLRWLIAAGLCTLFVAHALYTTRGVLVDDAYIAIRYALRLAAGHGLTFQAGPPVEGYTCFSWVLLGALLEQLGASAAAFLPLLGVVCGALAVGLTVTTAQRWDGARSGLWAGVLPGLFLACLPSLAYYSGSGLETGLHVLLVQLTLLASLKGRATATGVYGGLALLTRPEGAVVAGIALLIGLRRAAPEQRRPWLLAAAGMAALGLAYAAFKWSYFGALLPNTAVAKAPDIQSGLRYLWLGSIDAGPLLLLAAALVWRGRRAFGQQAGCLVLASVLAAIAALEGGDWMPGSRLLLPALVMAAPALDALWPATGEQKARSRVLVAALSAAAAAFYLRWSAYDTQALAEMSVSTAAQEPQRDDIAQRMLASGITSVGTLDIGRISYAAPELRIVDLGGLIDREIARLPGDYRSKRIPPAALEGRVPDAFLLSASRISPRPGAAPKIDFYYPVERELASSAWFGERYALRTVLHVQPGYSLCWYESVTRAR